VWEGTSVSFTVIEEGSIMQERWLIAGGFLLLGFLLLCYLYGDLGRVHHTLSVG